MTSNVTSAESGTSMRIPGGYAGKWLDVNLTTGDIDIIKFPWEILEQYFGGRGMASKILWDRIGKNWSEIDALAPESPLIIATGPMTGIYPGARICVSGKSPASNGVVGSTAATETAVELKNAGYDGIIFTGKSKNPVYFLITDDGAELMNASHLWGLEADPTIVKLNKEVRTLLEKRKPKVGLWKEPATMYIGPAGENLVRNSAVCTKMGHAAGYGGYGALMGSKKLKAIAVKSRGRFPTVDAPETIKVLWRKIGAELIKVSQMRRWGTGHLGYGAGYGSSSEPIRNWQEEYHNEKSMGVNRYMDRFWVKDKWADFGCTLNCMKVSCIKQGKWEGDITDTPDYELQAYCGTNFGIFDAENNIHLSTLMDQLGHSGINGANTVGFAAELYQRGILTKEDIGFEIKWGDVDAFDKLTRMIAYRKGIGDVLAEGSYRAALKIAEMKGLDTNEIMKYVVHVKGIEIGAHGTRSDADYTHDMSYAASVQGGDHSSVAVDGYNDMSGAVFFDSAVYCTFTSRGPSLPLQFDFAKAVTGFPITLQRWRSVNGPRIITLQKAFLLMGGPDLNWEPIKDDDNPPRFYEPLPSGPFKGKTTDKERVDLRIQSYFQTLGWDERGIPMKETLNKLDLGFLDKYLAKYR
jgi:aldehyde:ferredoxin oxidoreductase